MTTFEIRAARSEDGSGVAEAWQDSAEFYRQIAPDWFRSPRSDGLARWLVGKLVGGGADRLALVADQDGEAVGFVHAALSLPIEDADRQVTRDAEMRRVFVNALAVQRSHWRSGVGTALMEAVERWARERGAELLTLETFAASPVSVPFYEDRMGYERHAIVFAKRLRET
ncbi:GNAT family N-acetyltransferase [Actinomadura bangladeshensis]|uniref:GNAT family N-acetyltransferase n=1 Tax=Actinomadura bangladeshensis TaxID=453573 RepID=A0A6L9QDL5_9ACTN|nr:GNAT family N-acetyltransferase [Actinomadura bangladeshensis]